MDASSEALRGADVVALRVAEDKRLRGDVEDGRLAEGKAVGGRADARAANDVWDVGVAEAPAREALALSTSAWAVMTFGLFFRARADCARERYLRNGRRYRKGQGRARDQVGEERRIIRRERFLEYW